MSELGSTWRPRWSRSSLHPLAVLRPRLLGLKIERRVFRLAFARTEIQAARIARDQPRGRPPLRVADERKSGWSIGAVGFTIPSDEDELIIASVVRNGRGRLPVPE